LLEERGRGGLGRDQLAPSSSAPLQIQRFGGAVDVVGGKTLAQILPQPAYGSSLAACGLAGGSSFETTVFPCHPVSGEPPEDRFQLTARASAGRRRGSD
jgi:acrylyl-CoA reductase (NADPH)